ncbi:MAG: zinc metalloprotease HtpX [Thermoleophilia bacterium]|nr:zinc metalloprotease HtpX [Thermoleophilia bacterium]
MDTRKRAFGRDAGLSGRMALTTLLLGGLYVVFFVVLLQLFSLSLGAVIAIMAALAFLQYFTSDRIALAASGAKVVQPEQAPDLHAMVERLSTMAGLPKPRVAVIDTDVPNAFATGRNPKHAAVAITRGLWQRLEPREVEAVLAHELAHIRHRDVAIMTIASFFSMVAAMLMRFGLFAGLMGGNNRDQNAAPVWLIMFLVSLLTYVVSYVLLMALSRYREYAADRGAAEITGEPEHLVGALRKIAERMTQVPQRELRQAASLNAFFILPTVKELFSTHPPLERRIERLEALARERGRLA